jgi:hypothetical protein
VIDKVAATVFGVTALAACSVQQAPTAADPGPPPAPGSATNKCDNSNIQQFVGKQRSPELEKQMLSVSGAAFVRWAEFGTMVTMEYRADRLTVFLDANNRVDRISCS